ncbi:hypothetical protein Chls_692 [Chlamydia suis]|uniref:Uncharacterized protein n=1 Tax=Chlamydia suis TaxID=83559 RepID=A0ABX6IUH6_9CHLA|nr:hypothetical protein Chls_692 [Chlamydia suis]
MFLFILELFPNLYYTVVISFKNLLVKEDLPAFAGIVYWSR